MGGDTAPSARVKSCRGGKGHNWPMPPPPKKKKKKKKKITTYCAYKVNKCAPIECVFVPLPQARPKIVPGGCFTKILS